MPYSEKGIELACRLGHEQKAELVLTYVLEVPRILPLNARMPEAETKAQEALERAREIVSLHGLGAQTLIERAREAGEGIIRAAKDQGVDAIVLGIRPRLSLGQDLLGRTTDILLRRAPCEVIIDKPAA
jgi:nucleotide-binding universal stress UspA family protein